MGDGGGGTGATGAEADTVAAGRARAVSRSRRTTRPPGPDPVSSFRSTPVSLAMRLASGDALTRVASAGAGDGGRGRGAEGDGAAGGGVTRPSSPVPRPAGATASPHARI